MSAEIINKISAMTIQYRSKYRSVIVNSLRAVSRATSRFEMTSNAKNTITAVSKLRVEEYP